MMERLEKFLSFASHDPPPEEAHFKLSHYRNSNQLVLLDFVFSTCAVGTPACPPARGARTGACLCLCLQTGVGTQTGQTGITMIFR